MRLTRRIAIVALSAAMALSMLTACGGGENPPASNGDGTGAGISSGSGNGTEPGNDNNAGTGTGTAGDNGTANPSTWTSRAAKYFTRKGVTGKTRYIRYSYTVELYDFVEDKAYDSVEEIIEACDGTRHYQNVPAFDSENREVRVNQLYDSRKEVIYEYCCGYEGEKTIIENEAKYSQDLAKKVSYVPDDINLFRTEPAEPRTIEGVEYYCEKDKNSYCRYYCFDKNDTEGLDLKYIVNIDGSGWETVIKIKEVRPNFDPALMQIPEGYTNVKTGEVTGKDSYPNN